MNIIRDNFTEEMKKILLQTMISFLILGGSVAYAETVTEVNVSATASKPALQGLPQKMKELIENKKDVRRDAVDAVKTVRKETKTAIKDVRMSNASTSDKKIEVKDLREKMASTTQDIRGEMRDERAKITGEQKQVVSLKIDNELKKMTDRFQATIEREETIMAKIATRITKIKTAGGNTTVAEKMVTDATMHMTEAKSAMLTLKLTVASTTAQTSASTTMALPKEALAGLRKASRDIEKHLREAHNLLEKAVGNLMGNGMKNATTTSTN